MRLIMQSAQSEKSQNEDDLNFTGCYHEWLTFCKNFESRKNEKPSKEVDKKPDNKCRIHKKF